MVAAVALNPAFPLVFMHMLLKSADFKIKLKKCRQFRHSLANLCNKSVWRARLDFALNSYETIRDECTSTQMEADTMGTQRRQMVVTALET